MTNNNESIQVQFPKCKEQDHKDTYLKFFHGLVWSGGNGDWYYCPKCHNLYLIKYD
jgi:methionine salvage enolase-phosphatase E1